MGAPGRAAPPTVLVVDDEGAIRNALQAWFAASFPDARIETAGSGREALAILERGPVDVVLSDYHMPDMDGVEFLSHTKRLRPSAHRILITAFPERVREVAGAGQHYDEMFTKPLDPHRLMAAVTPWMGEADAA